MSAEREPVAQTLAAAEAEFEELDVDAPRVGIVMGSKSDLPAMEARGAGADRARDPLRGYG